MLGEPSAMGTPVLHVGCLPMILNSLFNPVIYTVGKKQFRITFIKLLLTKDVQEAKENERLFRSPNIVEPERFDAGRRSRTGQEQKPEGITVVHVTVP